MAVVYYDNLAAADDLPGYVEVERIYCFAWDRFLESHWQELSRIYDVLPGGVHHREIPYWYGQDEERPPFLSASVEPPGLQVYGVLAENDWLAWDEAFRAQAGGLPMRVLR